jgi:hypothetical protein
MCCNKGSPVLNARRSGNPKAKQPCSQAALQPSSLDSTTPHTQDCLKKILEFLIKKKVCRKPGTPGTRHPNQDYLKKVLTF